ncbi:DEAD/DEAH box helicase [Babesia caballi]|uniref:RNA helicase n=1 Tax=Babesia caballi TaxID=5871 RepID=A0AAV4M0F8_BABCB|nr:DEAD/DEAH box helicase [Babesia caballi]
MDSDTVFKQFLESSENAALRDILVADNKLSQDEAAPAALPDSNNFSTQHGIAETERVEQPQGQPTEAAPELDEEKPKHLYLNEIEDEINVNGAQAQECDMQWTHLMLSPDLLRGIHHKGFVKPSRIQQVALPLILGKGSNIIAQAKNGSGKTATFALALLSKVDQSVPAIQGMCLCPTRELAVQNVQVMAQLGKFTRIKIFLGVPQCSRYEPEDEYHLYVGTPGKTLEFLRKRSINFFNTKMIVMDEADELINQENNMGPQVMQIRLSFRRPVQILLFSATFSEEVYKFATRVAPDAHIIQVRLRWSVAFKALQVKREQLTLDCIEQRYMVCTDDNDKFKKLCEFYASMIIGQSVIFANSRESAFNLSQRMRDHGHAVSLLCGSLGPRAGLNSMTPEIRDRIMREFKDGETKVLICTDVLARGIDVPQVTLVVNYELPFVYSGSARLAKSRQICMVSLQDACFVTLAQETYLHRIGRTGRFGAKGMAINMVTPDELELIESIKQFYKCQIEALECDPESIENVLRNIRA